MDIMIHGAKDMRVRNSNPDNMNSITLSVPVVPFPYVALRGSADRTDDNITIFGLPESVTDALKWALQSEKTSGTDRIEALAERIEEVMDNVNDMDVQFSDFALAIACDLTGADLTEAYAARKAAKVAAE